MDVAPIGGNISNPSIRWLVPGSIAVLFLVFQQIYFYIGCLLAGTDLFSQRGWDVLFNADIPRVMRELTVFDANHYKAIVHPLFVFFLNPVGRLLTSVTYSEITASLLLNSSFGGLAVVLCFYYFYLVGRDILASVLLAVVFGLTTTQLVFGSIPETYIVATCTIIFAHILVNVSSQGKIVSMWKWVLAGVLTLGVTTTNVVQGMICFVSSQLLGKGRIQGKLVQHTATFVMSTLAVALMLNYVQKVTYHGARLFISPDVVEQNRYVRFDALKKPVAAVRDTFRNMFIYNVIAPQALIGAAKGWRLPTVGFDSYSMLGRGGLMVWGMLMIVAVWRCFKEVGLRNPMVLAGAAGLVFNAVLHNFYGSEHKFLYSGHYTFLLFVIFLPLAVRMGARVRSGIAMLIVLMAANNGLFIREVLEVFRR